MLAPKGWTCRKVEMIPEAEQSQTWQLVQMRQDVSRLSNTDTQQEDLLLLYFLQKLSVASP